MEAENKPSDTIAPKGGGDNGKPPSVFSGPSVLIESTVRMMAMYAFAEGDITHVQTLSTFFTIAVGFFCSFATVAIGKYQEFMVAGSPADENKLKASMVVWSVLSLVAAGLAAWSAVKRQHEIDRVKRETKTVVRTEIS